jgi:hypothetical protein
MVLVMVKARAIWRSKSAVHVLGRFASPGVLRGHWYMCTGSLPKRDQEILRGTTVEVKYCADTSSRVTGAEMSTELLNNLSGRHLV